MTATPKKYVFGAALPSSDNPWWIAARQAWERMAKEEGIELKVLIANEDSAKQMKDVEDLIQIKPDCLLMGPVDANASIGAVDSAAAAGIPVFLCARKTASTKFTAFIGPDEVEFGRGSGRYITSVLDKRGGGGLVIIRGPAGLTHYNEQEQGLMEIIAKYPSVKILGKLLGRDNQDTGMTLMEDALQAYGKKISAIYCCNDPMALGAIGTLESAGLPLYPANPNGIVVTGNNCNPDGIQAIKDGKMAYAGFKQPEGIARFTWTKMTDYVIKGKRDIPRICLVPLLGVTRENINSIEYK